MSLATIEKNAIDKLFSLDLKVKKAFYYAIEQDNKDEDNMDCMLWLVARHKKNYWINYDKAKAKTEYYLQCLKDRKDLKDWAKSTIVDLYKAVGGYGKEPFIKALAIYDIEVV